MMEKLGLKYWAVEKLIEYDNNPRKNNHAVDKIAAAIKEFGFRVPILAKSDGLIVDGHLRLKAAKKLGLESVSVILADDLTDAQIKAFRISVNRMAELTEWDEELLRLELIELKELDFNLELVGFEDFDLKIETEHDKEVDGEITEPPVKPVTKLGDIWLLGDHRLMCGDSTSIEAACSAVKMYGSTFELCWSKNKHKQDMVRIKWAGVFGIEQEFDRKRWHPTQKPIKLAEFFLNKYSNSADIILDLFGGSGSTLIACENTGRKCYMMEFEPKYCDVIVNRWETLTGKKAGLEDKNHARENKKNKTG